MNVEFTIKKNNSTLKKIDHFAQNCSSYNAICEYTKDTFLYRIINRALRTQNMEIIKKFRSFITDLNSQLYETYEKGYNSKICPIRVVYRGQALSVSEFEYLGAVCRSKNPIITLTTFGSASLDPEVAMNFLPSSGNHIPCLFEIIITDEYKIEENVPCDAIQAFANITSLSVIPDVQEVLFFLLTHFRVQNIGDLIVQLNRRWVPITLELINPNKGNYGYIVNYIFSNSSKRKKIHKIMLIY